MTRTESEQRELALRIALEIVEEWLSRLRDYTLVAPEFAGTKEELLSVVRDTLREGKDK